MESPRVEYSNYKTALPQEKREILETVTSNRGGSGNTIGFSLQVPFNIIAARTPVSLGGEQRYDPRTSWERLLPQLWEWATANSARLEGIGTLSSSFSSYDTASGTLRKGWKPAA